MVSDRRADAARRPSAGTPTNGVLRLTRGVAVGSTAVGLALAGHAAAGGGLPAVTTVVPVLVLTVAGSVALSGRRWTVSSLLTVLLGVQVVFHVAFGSHPMAGMTAGQHAAHSLTASMILAHVLAASATALLLSRGESWCWRLVALVSRPVRAARVFGEHSAPLRRVPRVSSPSSPLPVLRSLLLADAQARRGPPALLAG
jgi:hypothetical protein